MQSSRQVGALHNPVGGKSGRRPAVLHKSELVAVGIGHGDDCALVVVMSFAGRLSPSAVTRLMGSSAASTVTSRWTWTFPAFGSCNPTLSPNRSLVVELWPGNAGPNNGWSSMGRHEMLPLTSRQVFMRKEVRIDV
jgi:hypothetical protein